MNGKPIDINCEELKSTNLTEHCQFPNIDDIGSTSNYIEDNESLTQVLSKEFQTSNEESQNEEDIIPDRFLIINKNLENVPHLIDCNKNTDKKKITFKVDQYLGKKRKHDKFSEDDEFRKIKVMLKDALISFINNKITEKGIDLNNICGKKAKDVNIKNINQKIMIDNKIKTTRKLFDTTIKDFLSDKISGRYSTYPKDFNERVLQKLYENESFKEILDKKILDCINHCIKYCIKNENKKEEIENSCLNGFEKEFKAQLDDLKTKNEQEYIDSINKLITEIEVIYKNKKPKKKKKGVDKKFYK